MPKLIPQNELDAVQEAAAHFPEGASNEEISSPLAIKMPRRTLQRRLALLVKLKRPRNICRSAQVICETHIVSPNFAYKWGLAEQLMSTHPPRCVG